MRPGFFSVTTKRRLFSVAFSGLRGHTVRGSQRQGFEDEYYSQQTNALRIDFLGKLLCRIFISRNLGSGSGLPCTRSMMGSSIKA